MANSMSSPLVDAAKELVANRPAESITVLAGSLGLIFVQLIADGSDDLKTGLIILLTTLPAVVTRIYNLGGGDGRAHDFNTEIDELKLRTVRRARLGHPNTADDINMVKSLMAMNANPPS
jgi:hypothetical protein